MEQWTNSNIHRTVTDMPFLHANMSKCMFDPKNKNPYWQEGTYNYQYFQLAITQKQVQILASTLGKLFFTLQTYNS